MPDSCADEDSPKFLNRIREIFVAASELPVELRARFGLGDASIVETLRAEWPSGIVQERRGVAVNQFLVIEERG